MVDPISTTFTIGMTAVAKRAADLLRDLTKCEAAMNCIYSCAVAGQKPMRASRATSVPVVTSSSRRVYTKSSQHGRSSSRSPFLPVTSTPSIL